MAPSPPPSPPFSPLSTTVPTPKANKKGPACKALAVDPLPKETREELALQSYSKALECWDSYKQALPLGEECKQDKPSFRYYAHKYDISKDTLCRRFNSKHKPHRSGHQGQQRLSPVEETNLKTWILMLAEWGFPPLVGRIRVQAEELLKARGDCKPLGVNWVQKLLKRHPELESRFIQSMDKERVNAMNYDSVSDWFNLYRGVLGKYQILKEDTYNMDEKGFALGQIGKQKVIASKHRLNTVLCQSGNREWVSLIECISADGVLLPAFIIFKAKRQQQAWMDVLERPNQVALSDKGWTNNELAVEWFQRVFQPFTRQRQKGEYRLLILDGHDSHISSKVIEYCIKEKIVLTCLPSHTTHALQPLDVGFFQPLATLYQSKLIHSLNLDSSTNVDKVIFIELFQEARRQAAKQSTILSAWEKAFLFPFDPERLLKTLPGRPKEVEVPQRSRPFTPPKVAQIYRASGGTSACDNLTIPETERREWDKAVLRARYEPSTDNFNKLNKMQENIRVQRDLERSTARQLFQNQQRQDRKKERSKKQLGKARVMSHEVLDERKEQAEQAKKQKADIAKRKEATAKAKKEAKEAEKTFLQAIESISTLFGESRKPASPKKHQSTKASIVPFVIDLEAPILAPPVPNSPSKDPERPSKDLERSKGRKSQQKGKPKAKKAPVQGHIDGNVDKMILSAIVTASGRTVKPPRRRD